MRGSIVRRGLIVAVLVVLSTAIAHVQAAPTTAPSQQPPVAPTYRIFATREGLVGYRTANGHIIQPRDRFVALPCWCALSPKGTDKFKVRLTYNGRSVVVPVWDVGPWNTRDDYWNPNRRYSDLPVGMPMAEAAYFHGYNGGRDEWGRRITLPNGIDIADGTFWDDLGMTRSDYVYVTFLWLGEDPGPGDAVEVGPNQFTDDAAQQTVTAPEGAFTVDNTDTAFNPVGKDWYEERCGLNGQHQWTYSTTDPAKATTAAAWTAPNLSPGFYEVKAYIPTCGNPATTSARYRISHAGATTEVTLDQRSASGQWASLGTYYFGGAGNEVPQVFLSDLTGDRGMAVRYDAIAWEPRSDTTPPNTQILSMTRAGNGFLIKWGGNDDMTGIASYDVQVRLLPDGGWTDWKKETTDLSAWFGPDEGKQFAFRVRARDWAGNVEPWEEAAIADTTNVP